MYFRRKRRKQRRFGYNKFDLAAPIINSLQHNPATQFINSLQHNPATHFINSVQHNPKMKKMISPSLFLLMLVFSYSVRGQLSASIDTNKMNVLKTRLDSALSTMKVADYKQKFPSPERLVNAVKGWQDAFDMNVHYQLKKIGVPSQLEKMGFESQFGTSSNTSKCYGDLGCIEVSENWYGLSRPINVLPQGRESINTQFILRTRETINAPVFLNVSVPATISESSFNSSRKSVLIVHGFIDTGFVHWVRDLSKKLLLYDDLNIISVDWGGGSAAMYSTSAANTRLVGLEVSHLIKHLKDVHNATVGDFHIIGHSLGSHIAGYAGENIQKLTKQKLGRISGLDPAAPLFEGMPEFVRLDPSDAIFVDVIHTDATNDVLNFGYGMRQPVGHIDFYPNGGRDQPGCSLLDIPVSLDSVTDPDKTADTVGRHLVACSHTRAVELYIESVDAGNDGSCVNVGFECSSYEEFKLGLCFNCGEGNNHCAKVGHPAIEYKPIIEKYSRSGVKLFLNTGSNSPFCQYHYLLELNLANPSIAETWVQGFIKVNLYGSHGEVTDLNLTPKESIQLVHGMSKRFLLSFSNNLGYINLINFEWVYDHDINPLDLLKVCVLLCSDKIHIQNVSITSLHSTQSTNDTSLETFPQKHETTICGNSSEGYTTVKSGEWKMFYKLCY